MRWPSPTTLSGGQQTAVEQEHLPAGRPGDESAHNLVPPIVWSHVFGLIAVLWQ